MRKILPITIAILCGLVVLIDFFIQHPLIDQIGAILTEGVVILAGFGLLLGVLNLLRRHGRLMLEDHPEAQNRSRGASLALLAGLLGVLALGIAAPTSHAFRWVFDYLYYPLQATMAALLVFFITSGLFRAFKLKNGHALVLLGSSLLILFLELPISNALSAWVPAVRDWIYQVPVTAGMRGLILGTALGTIATSLRILLAVDHPYA